VPKIVKVVWQAIDEVIATINMFTFWHMRIEAGGGEGARGTAPLSQANRLFFGKLLNFTGKNQHQKWKFFSIY